MNQKAALKRLLILSCSQRKRPNPGLLPAIERYSLPEKFLPGFGDTCACTQVQVLGDEIYRKKSPNLLILAQFFGKELIWTSI